MSTEILPVEEQRAAALDSHTSTDLQRIGDLLGACGGPHFGAFNTAIRLVASAHGLRSSLFMLLAARAYTRRAELHSSVCSFAAALELMLVAVTAHARIVEPGSEGGNDNAATVLIGDLLYTHGFRLIAAAGHWEGIARLSGISNRMVVAATSTMLGAPERLAELYTVTYGGCAELAAVLTDAAPLEAERMIHLGEQVGALVAASGEGEGAVHARARCIELIEQTFAPSLYRDLLVEFVR